jgi:hypothetical protein
MPEPIGMRRVSCSAHDGPRQCRAYTKLTPVAVALNEQIAGSLILPKIVVLMLCPKHFIRNEEPNA